jgi:hypothetical protein
MSGPSIEITPSVESHFTRAIFIAKAARRTRSRGVMKRECFIEAEKVIIILSGKTRSQPICHYDQENDKGKALVRSNQVCLHNKKMYVPKQES